MSFLSIFDNFSFSTHWPYILLFIGIIAALVIVIMFVRKHIALTVVIIIFGGLLVGYYFGNLYFALGFNESMTCDALRKDESEYVKYELGEVYIYQKKNVEDGKVIDNSDDIFAVKKLWFVYYSMKPTKEFEAKVAGKDEYTIAIKEYKVDDKRIYQFVPQQINDVMNTTVKPYLNSIKVTYTDNSTGDLTSEQLYIFQTDKEIKSFKAFGVEYSVSNSLSV